MSAPEFAPNRARASASGQKLGKAIVLLILVGLIAYSNSFSKIFQFDDNLWITGTDTIKDLGEYLAALRLRPVAAVTLYLNYRLHGLQVFGYHLVNLAVHIAAALTLFGLVRHTLLLPRWQGRFMASATWLAFAVALIWLVHPVQTQAVTYITQRMEAMMGLCYLLTFYCLVRGAQASKSWLWYVAAWWSCLVGAGCKEVMITLPPILLAYDRLFIAPWPEIARRRWLFYLALLAIWVLPLLIALPLLLATTPDDSVGFTQAALPPDVYWMTQGWVLLHYLRLCLLPYPQFFNYREWPHTTTVAEFWPAALMIGDLILLIGWLLWRRSWVGFLGLWFFGILSLTSFIPLADVAFEHRLYLPLAAIVVLVVVGGYQGLVRFSGANRSAALSTLSLFVVSSVLMVLTLKRNEDYASFARLWSSVLEAQPQHASVLNGIADECDAQQQPVQALEYYRKSLDAAPGNFHARFKAGRLLSRQDNWAYGDKLLSHCMKELKSSFALKNSPVVAGEVGQWCYEAGVHQSILGRWKEAEDFFRAAVARKPHQARYHAALALALQEQNRAAESRACYQLALERDPAWPQTARRLAIHFLHQDRHPSVWTRKETLFYAKQGAQASEYNDLMLIDVLVEAYASNGMFEQAKHLSHQAAQTVALNNMDWQAQIVRTIAYYQQKQTAAAQIQSRKHDGRKHEKA